MVAKNFPEPNVTRLQKSDRVSLHLQALGWQIGLIVFFIILWQWAVNEHWINGFLTGSPALIWRSAVSLWNSGSLPQDISVTSVETILGFTLGTVVGTSLGYMFWYWPVTARIFQPFAVIFNGIPKIALAPLIIIWFGTGLQSKVLLAFTATVIVALLAAFQGAQELDVDWQHLLQGFGAKKWQIFWLIIVPGSLPWVINAMRINVGMALVGAVIGEFIASQTGLGHAVFVAGNLFELNVVWVGVIALSFLALVLYGVVAIIERFAIRGRPW